jgi:hypothetical protein
MFITVVIGAFLISKAKIILLQMGWKKVISILRVII